MEEAERPRVRRGRGNEGRGEGFITKDLLLLPGGGEALERRCIRVWGGAFIRCTDLCICIYMYIRV